MNVANKLITSNYDISNLNNDYQRIFINYKGSKKNKEKISKKIPDYLSNLKIAYNRRITEINKPKNK
jgi:hypothetical protein